MSDHHRPGGDDSTTPHPMTPRSGARAPHARLRMLRLTSIAAVVLGVGLASIAVTARNKAAPAVANGAPTAGNGRDVPRVDGKFIRFSPEFAKRSGIELAKADAQSLKPMIQVTGTATFDPEAVSAVGSRIAGRVRRVLKYPGDPVKRGDVLAELESAELGQAQASVLGARAQVEAATANEKREKQLAEARVSSQRDYELAHSTAQAARAALFAADQKVRAFGGSSGGEIGVLPLKSPIDGKIMQTLVSRGQSVEPSFTAFKVADIRTLWIELAVFERDLAHVRQGDRAEISPQTNLQMVVQGKVAHVGDAIDLDTRSAPVRVEIDNKDEMLRPGQSVSAKIHTKTAPEALTLPRDAVTTVDGKTTVFVAHDETSVEPRTVILGAKDATRVEVKQGIDAGDMVVVKGVFALKSEVFR